MNPNNTGLEASPLTTLFEIEVGLQLCKMVGYKRQLAKSDDGNVPVGWGHITSGGTVANLESMWAGEL